MELPQNLADRLEAFLKSGQTGNFVLDIKDGRIVGWKATATEHGHIDKRTLVSK